MSGKLTKAQRALLEKIKLEPKAVRPARGSAAQALFLAGYAEWDDQAGGGNWWLMITPAGRAALAKDGDHGR